jgi:hypothetical protein
MSRAEEVAAAVEAERQRCVEILELYQKEFGGSPLLQSLWCRIRNQIAMGTPSDEADFRSQFEDDDE